MQDVKETESQSPETSTGKETADSLTVESQPDDVKQEGEEQVDWESVAKQYKTESDNKTIALQKERSKRREPQEAAVEDVSKLVEEQVDQRMAGFIKQTQKQQFENELSGITEDPNKQEVIRHLYQNNIRPSGNVASDLKMCETLAEGELQRAKARAQGRREGMRNLKQEAMASTGASGGSIDTSMRPVEKSDKEKRLEENNVDVKSTSELERTLLKRRGLI